MELYRFWRYINNKTKYYSEYVDSKNEKIVPF